MTRSVSLTIDAENADDYHRKGWWRDETLLDDFLRNVVEYPDKLAVISDHADQEQEVLTFGELGELVDRIAGGLIEVGVLPGEVVSFQLPNWWQFIALYLACARIGAVTNAILPILRGREVRFILQRTQSRLFLVPDSYRGFDYVDMACDVQSELPSLQHVFSVGGDTPRWGVDSFEQFFLQRRWEDVHPTEELDRRRPDADSAAQIQFTSGTTGEPKGVIHTYNTIWAGMRSIADPLALGFDDVVLAVSPMSHTVGFYFGCTLPMSRGMTVVQQDTWDPVHMLELVAANGITWTMVAPTFLADVCRAAAATTADTSSMRFISCAGAPIAPVVIADVRERLGATVLAAWGMTECGAVTTTLPGDTEDQLNHTDGGPRPWGEIRIVDGRGNDVPDGTPGRLHVRGASVAITYHQRPDLFEAAVQDGWFDTQDLAIRRADGYIRLCGRTKDLIIRGAENIPVVEVESMLLRHPAVREVAVIAVPDARLGERACAVVVPQPGSEPPTLADLTAHLDAHAMAKHFWPEHIRIVRELPKTPTGKIQKFRLREESGAWGLNLSDDTAEPIAATPGES